MIPDTAIAVLHTAGCLMFFALAIEVWLRRGDVFATGMRLILGMWFLRLACGWWAETGHDWLAWAQSNDTIFYAALLLYVGFFVADRHRWWEQDRA